MKASHSITSDYQAQSATLEEQGTQQGLSPERVAPFSEARVEKILSDTPARLQERRSDLFAHKDSRENAITEKAQENVVTSNVQDTSKNLLGTAKQLAAQQLLGGVTSFASSEAKASQPEKQTLSEPIRPQDPTPQPSATPASQDIRPQQRKLRTLPDKKTFKHTISQNKK